MDCPPPPLALILDDPAAADPARQKIAPKSRFSRLFSLPNRHSSSSPNLRPVSPVSSSSEEEPPALAADSTPIALDSSTLVGEGVVTDHYEWAVLYENQRGSVVSSFLLFLNLNLNLHPQTHCLFYTLLLQPITAAIRPLTLYSSECFSQALKTAPRFSRLLPSSRRELAMGVPLLDDRHALRHRRGST